MERQLSLVRLIRDARGEKSSPHLALGKSLRKSGGSEESPRFGISDKNHNSFSAEGMRDRRSRLVTVCGESQPRNYFQQTCINFTRWHPGCSHHATSLIRKHADNGCAIVKAAELALGTDDLTVGIKSCERRIVELLRNCVELTVKVLPQTQARGDAVKEQRGLRLEPLALHLFDR